MNITMSRHHFQFRLFPFIGTVCCFLLLVCLGVWQLHRAEYKRDLQQTLMARSQSSKLSLNELVRRGSDVAHFRTHMRGHYLNSKTFLLDNRFYQHRVGYEVISPFQPEGSNTLVLIDRGWVSMGKSRKVLPKIMPVNGLQTIEGIVHRQDRQVITLSDAKTQQSHWPRRIEHIDFDEISHALGRSVYSFTVLLDKHALGAYPSEYTPIRVKPERHVGYAIQWFVLASVLLVFYIVATLKENEDEA